MRIEDRRIRITRTFNDPPYWSAMYHRQAEDASGNRPAVTEYTASASGSTEFDALMRLANMLGDGR